ncbi:lipopolysaccharide transport system ATP-binding protein [Niveibacterium umoris]|uniref:Lipopolysaccharide transport system ATP-binding protein n=3 Tax=Niveibacterium umoris TaxID=1193620 RepID=A0A840BP62_9RHOO|nr:lipopolysaccharide transport system ATP-binding protein [Niveibacterium umoris]
MIRAIGLSKCYQIYEEPRHRLMQMLARGRKRYYREFWALRDVSFSVAKGETVGIVGRNGSGKSTLLQMICGTLNPTAGEVSANGRIAALLELGSGFNPEFSGRENVYLNAAVLGLSREDVDQCFDEIVAFSGIEEFIDQPVKTYSSGMVVRLAFAVQVQVKPDVLVVDEALAVGDEAFQRKCYLRLQELKADGVAVLFVSHDAGTVLQLCDRVILLDAGKKIMEGEPKPVVALYQKLVYATRAAANEIIAAARPDDTLPDTGVPQVVAVSPDFDPELVPQTTLDYASRGAAIHAVEVQDELGRLVNQLQHGAMYTVRFRATFDSAAQSVIFGMMAKTAAGVEIGGAVTDTPGSGLARIEPGERFDVVIRFRCLLNPGVYFLNVGIMGAADGELTYLARKVDAVMVRVKPERAIRATGLVDLDVTATAERVGA